MASSVTVKQLDKLLTEHSVTSSAGCVSVGKCLSSPVVMRRCFNVRCSHVWWRSLLGKFLCLLCAALEFWHLPQYQRHLRLLQIIFLELGSRELLSDLPTTCSLLSCRPGTLFRNLARPCIPPCLSQPVRQCTKGGMPTLQTLHLDAV